MDSKDKRKKINLVLSFILGIVVSATTVYAATTILASDVGFTSIQGLTSNNVQDAIDEVYNKINSRTDIAYVDENNNVQTKFCIRASKLHAGGYGRLGTLGTLTTGDAFDCDINGDGLYDSDTERFYYIGKRAYGGSTAQYVGLIYYDNTAGAGIYDCDSRIGRSGGTIYKLNKLNASHYTLPTKTIWPRAGKTGYLQKYSVQWLVNEKESDALMLTMGLTVTDSVALLPSYYYLRQSCSDDDGSVTQESLWSKCNFLFENVSRSDTGYKGYYIDRVSSDRNDANDDDGFYYIGGYTYQRSTGSYTTTMKYETTRCNSPRGIRPMMYLDESDLQV